VILLDSNIVIYLRDPKLGPRITEQLGTHRIDTCNIVVAEVLGFRGLTPTDADYFERLFATMRKYPFDDNVTKTVIDLRRSLSIQLPDAIIAATALVNNATLWTHNAADFRSVANLRIHDPIE
jgi:predicted nucleic acid-binding protein